MPAPELKFYTNLVVPGVTENGFDVVNTDELATILSTTIINQSTNINGGTSNQLTYQTDTNTTGFVTAPTTSDTYLKWNGTGFVWSLSGGAVSSVAGRTGEVTLSTSDISGYGTFVYGSIIGSTLTTSTTSANQVLSNISATEYRTVDYFIQIVSGTSYETTRVAVIHNGTDVVFNEYNTLVTGSSLATFDVDLSAGNIRLLVTPTNAVTVFKVFATAILL